MAGRANSLRNDYGCFDVLIAMESAAVAELKVVGDLASEQIDTDSAFPCSRRDSMAGL